jgi:DNA-binding PucR family transcriptional regulator
MGRCHPGLQGIERSYREAQISFRSACRPDSPGSGGEPFHVRRFDKLGLERILFSDHPATDAQLLADECLEKIIRYDQEKNGQLLRTLRAFLQANGNHAEAAHMLFVHKNTIKYRLQLIRELTGLHPENGQDQLLFRIALTVHAIGDAG